MYLKPDILYFALHENRGVPPLLNLVKTSVLITTEVLERYL